MKHPTYHYHLILLDQRIKLSHGWRLESTHGRVVYFFVNANSTVGMQLNPRIMSQSKMPSATV